MDPKSRKLLSPHVTVTPCLPCSAAPSSRLLPAPGTSGYVHHLDPCQDFRQFESKFAFARAKENMPLKITDRTVDDAHKRTRVLPALQMHASACYSTRSRPSEGKNRVSRSVGSRGTRNLTPAGLLAECALGRGVRGRFRKRAPKPSTTPGCVLRTELGVPHGVYPDLACELALGEYLARAGSVSK